MTGIRLLSPATSRIDARCAGSRCELTTTSADMLCCSSDSAMSRSSADSVAGDIETVPGKPAANGAAWTAGQNQRPPSVGGQRRDRGAGRRFGNNGVGAHRQMRAVRLHRPDREEGHQGPGPGTPTGAGPHPRVRKFGPGCVAPNGRGRAGAVLAGSPFARRRNNRFGCRFGHWSGTYSHRPRHTARSEVAAGRAGVRPYVLPKTTSDQDQDDSTREPVQAPEPVQHGRILPGRAASMRGSARRWRFAARGPPGLSLRPMPAPGTSQPVRERPAKRGN